MPLDCEKRDPNSFQNSQQEHTNKKQVRITLSVDRPIMNSEGPKSGKKTNKNSSKASNFKQNASLQKVRKNSGKNKAPQMVDQAQEYPEIAQSVEGSNTDQIFYDQEMNDVNA